MSVIFIQKVLKYVINDLSSLSLNKMNFEGSCGSQPVMHNAGLKSLKCVHIYFLRQFLVLIAKFKEKTCHQFKNIEFFMDSGILRYPAVACGILR